MNLRSRLLQRAFTRLAWLAVVLMLCAPLLSRALQAPANAGFAELCTAQGLKRVALPAMGAMSTADGGHAATSTPMQDAAAQHDGAACDYCVLAVRLLPLLLFVLALLPRLRALRPALRFDARALVPLPWPAHAARGPPLYA